MLIAGVDEAGRGSVLGPLVIAGAMINHDDLPQLSKLGVKDSKLLSPRKREKLYESLIPFLREKKTLKISPKIIDYTVNTGGKLHRLNRLEARKMAEVIELLNPDIVYVDAADVSENRFKQHILENLSIKPQIISEHKADQTYPIVSAASIIAKVERDAEISRLKKTSWDFGSGYPSDCKTISFLKNYLLKFGKFPDFTRCSWKTAKKIKQDYYYQQKTLI